MTLPERKEFIDKARERDRLKMEKMRKRRRLEMRERRRLVREEARERRRLMLQEAREHWRLEVEEAWERESLMKEMERVMSGKSKFYKTVSEFVRRMGISRRTLYRMRKRWLESGRRFYGLFPRSRGPKGLPYGKPPKYYERMIVKMHRRLGWSAPQIAAYLKTHNIANPSTGRPLSQRSCYDVLKRYPLN